MTHDSAALGFGAGILKHFCQQLLVVTHLQEMGVKGGLEFVVHEDGFDVARVDEQSHEIPCFDEIDGFRGDGFESAHTFVILFVVADISINTALVRFVWRKESTMFLANVRDDAWH